MKNKYIVSIYVAECNEFRNEGWIYEGIYDISEALEARNSLPSERAPVIGLRIHKKGEKELTDIQTDLLIGDVIHLESLEYIPRISSCDDAMNYIAELISRLPDLQIKGNIPEYLKDRIKAYDMIRENEKDTIKLQLIKKLSQLTAEAVKYSKSDDKGEQKYGAALLKYAISQKEAINNGQEDIDLSTFPLKELYCDPDQDERSNTKREESKQNCATSQSVPGQQSNPYKENSLLSKLYEYQMLIKQRSI